ncbi:hypothetical protein KAS31_00900 [Candidatus Parcubacteria bacterium]|nr:hypothetical protein [Candidatus Parcubacteria bacterium]
MQNKKPKTDKHVDFIPTQADKPKYVMTMSIILLIGALFGLIAYLIKNNEATNQLRTKQIETNKALNNEMSNNSENSSIINENDISDWKTYRNEEYGFEIILLESWKGYKVLEESWDGITLDGNSVKYGGPKIVIRDPKWSEYNNWQDIPILIFTKDEWQSIEANNLNIFAAPIAPEKLGENNKYVFALPPRWIGFTDASGQDEAQKIVETFKEFEKDETSNWKVYKSEKYGLEVKYPSQAIQNSRSSLEELFVTTTEKCANSDPYLQGEEFKGCQKIAVLVHTIKANFGSSAEAIKIGGLSGEKFYFRIPQNYTIDDVSIYRPIGQINAQVGKGPYWYKINVEYHLSEEDAAEKLFDQILSTFKFIEKDTEPFSCGDSTVKDIDNNIYNTVKIGEQCWLKENLKVTKDPEGEKIIRYCYNNDESICKTDGGLYDWNTTMNGSAEESTQGICPEGWHIPEDGEWHEMENGLAIGDCDANRSVLDHSEWGCDTAGTKLKAGGLSGFEGIFAGYRHPDSSFAVRGANAIFWSSTENGRSAWYRNLHSERSTIRRDAYGKTGSYSVRCLKN